MSLSAHSDPPKSGFAPLTISSIVLSILSDGVTCLHHITQYHTKLGASFRLQTIKSEESFADLEVAIT